MRIEIPSFKNRLLVGVCEVLAARSKTLNYSGEVSFQAATPDDGLEEIRLSITFPYTPYLDLRLLAMHPLADVSLSLALRSERRRSCGQALFSLRDALVSCHPQQFVDLLAWTMDERRYIRDDPLIVERLHGAWWELLSSESDL